MVAAAAPLLVLLGLMIYGLIWRPLGAGLAPLPLETIFGAATAFALAELFLLGRRWGEIQQSIIRKLSRALSATFILMLVGVIIGSWMVCGTLLMLVTWGLKLLNPDFIYFSAFLITAVFSTLTGTSWGSAGTVGVVVMGAAIAFEANPGIAAGAIIGGAFFGDKLSPLSDTTNLAAVAADVDLYDHIRSMMVTTAPSAVLAAVAYIVLGFTHPAGAALAGDGGRVKALTESLSEIFVFHPLLLLPPAIVLYGSLRRKPPFPTLLASISSAVVLALALQRFEVGAVAASLVTGFDSSMAAWIPQVSPVTVELVNRGGLNSMSEAVFTLILAFFFIGAIDVIDAMPRVVHRLFSFARSPRTLVLSALAATAVTNAMTSSQYTTSFVIGDAFGRRFDQLKVAREVLSRSLEDYGTMIESLVPWHVTTVFMVAALGVPWQQYAPWQLLSLINLVIAPALAVAGIGLFESKTKT